MGYHIKIKLQKITTTHYKTAFDLSGNPDNIQNQFKKHAGWTKMVTRWNQKPCNSECCGVSQLLATMVPPRWLSCRCRGCSARCRSRSSCCRRAGAGPRAARPWIWANDPLYHYLRLFIYWQPSSQLVGRHLLNLLMTSPNYWPSSICFFFYHAIMEEITAYFKLPFIEQKYRREIAKTVIIDKINQWAIITIMFPSSKRKIPIHE